MLRIVERNVRVHADEMRISDLALAEQDLRLCSILEKIYSDSFLSERLLLKGGTAINKLYLKTTPRLSIDLDFNHIGSKERVLSETKKIRELIQHSLSADSSYHVTFRHRYEQTTIVARYKPIFGTDQHIKLEISHVERFPILPLEQLEFRNPISDSMIWVNTYKLDELVSTKLRAFHERLSGRDLYDLYFISKLNILDQTAVRKMLIYYLFRSRKVFNPKTFFRRVEEASENNGIEDDVSGYVRNDIPFSMPAAASEVLSYCSFLKEIDLQDELFISLTKHLLIKQAFPKEHIDLIRKIDYPFRFLFRETESRNKLSEEAWNIKTDDIRLSK